MIFGTILMVTMVPFYLLLPDVGKFVLCSVVIAYLYAFLHLVEVSDNCSGSAG